MSLKKVTLASLILLSLTACSGGSKQGDNHNKVLSDTKLALKNADNKKIELEKALNQANTKLSEVEKKLNANKDKIAISSEELQKQKAELAKLAKEKSNLENQLNTVNEKLVGATNEKEDIKTQLATVNKEKKTLTDNLNALKESKRSTEAELAEARSQVEVAQAEKEATKTQLENANDEKAALADKLKTANADLETAKADKESAETKLADKQAVIDAIHHHILALPNQRYSTLDNINYDQLSIGQHKIPFIHISPAVADVGDGILTGDRYAYKQQYFLLRATSIKTGTLYDKPYKGSFRVDNISGQKTENLPSQGTVIYRGTAFNADNQGDLTYSINFADKTGYGELSNFTHWGNIQLEQGPITDSMIKSNATMADGTTGKYEVKLFGPNAEEIAGEVYMFKQLNEGIRSNGSSAKKYGAVLDND